MLRSILHRGPDGEDCLSVQVDYGEIHLGHCLLQIIAPSTDNRQPLYSRDGRYVLSFNGEIYNYQELRRILASSGEEFSTAGDTEVLLAWLIRYGSNGLEALNGMFALIFTDTITGSILIARDRFGVKPLYYHSSSRTFLACSEIKGLVASDLITRTPDPAQIRHYLRYRHVQKPGTIFQEIRELPEGQYLCISPNGKVSTPESYLTCTTLSFPTSSKSSLRDLLHDAIARQTISDVPVGLLLSGGVDSTLLLALLRESGHKHVPSFVIQPSDLPGSFGSEDAFYARQAARQYEAELFPVQVSGNLVQRLLDEVSILDQPVADTAFLMTSMLAEEARQSVGVVLSGAGADEWFGGYHRHIAFKRALSLHQYAKGLINAAPVISSLLPDGTDHPFRKQVRLFRKFLSGLHPDLPHTADSFRSLQIGQPIASNDWSHEKDPLEQMLWQDRHHYLISDVLSISDQASMIHGLELRTPYLDNRLAEFCLTEGASRLLQKGRKWMLSEELIRLGGRQYTRRTKEGLGLPVGHWLQQDQNQAYLKHLMPESHPLFQWISAESLSSIMQKHLRGNRDFSSEIMAISMLFSWWNQTFRS